METEIQQNDPSERLEVFTSAGAPTGTGATRAEIHRQGLWHQAFHCWIVRGALGPAGPGQEVILQRRSLHKDTFPGYWDASAAGHWRMGESARDASREVAEELGIAIPFDALRWVGVERSERSHANGLVDRELHQVYTARWDQPLTSYHPDAAEVSMVAAFVLPDLIRVASGDAGRITASEAIQVESDGAIRSVTATLTHSEFVPYAPERLQKLIDS